MEAGCLERGVAFDKLLSFFDAVSSPLRSERMKRAEMRDRDVNERSKGAKQARASGQKSRAVSVPAPDDGLIKAEPSAREIAAAKAARDRLYGAKTRTEVQCCTHTSSIAPDRGLDASAPSGEVHGLLTVSHRHRLRWEGSC